ncbi:MAG TPA: hypothetical protein VLY04_12285 [Bryobacteraceae bacterium]|nr:hypothetical protein [Bryobacteraceae bacterium]
MSTQRQIEANRLNAQKSTGPRSVEGKAVSSRNALKSGLDAEFQFVLGETPADFAILQSEYTQRFQPVTPEERFQVDTIIRSEWMLRRFFRVESHLWEFHTLRANLSEGVQLGEACHTGSTVFMRLQRRVTLAERSYKEAYLELCRLQQARRPHPDEAVELPGPEPAPPEEDTPELGSFLQSPSEPAAAPAEPSRIDPQPEQSKAETPELGSFRTPTVALPPEPALPFRTPTISFYPKPAPPFRKPPDAQLPNRSPQPGEEPSSR